MNRLKNIITYSLFFGSLLLPGICFSQLNRLTFPDIEAKQKTEPKNTVVFIQTNWCQYCKIMQNTTFKNKEIIERLNNEFYFTQLNAEEKSNLNFGGKTYRFKPSGMNTGIHELAETFATLTRKSGFPLLIILNPDAEILFSVNGFLSASDLHLVMNDFPSTKISD